MSKAPFKMKGFSGFGNSPLQAKADPANEGGKKHNKQHADGEFDGEGKANHPEHGPYTPEDKSPVKHMFGNKGSKQGGKSGGGTTDYQNKVTEDDERPRRHQLHNQKHREGAASANGHFDKEEIDKEETTKVVKTTDDDSTPVTGGTPDVGPPNKMKSPVKDTKFFGENTSFDEIDSVTAHNKKHQGPNGLDKNHKPKKKKNSVKKKAKTTKTKYVAG